MDTYALGTCCREMPNAFSSEGVNLPLLVCRNLSNFLEAVAGCAGVTESEKFLSSICVYFKHWWTSDGSVIENSTASAGDMSWVGKIPWRRKWQPTPVFLPGETHGQRSAVGCSPRR